MSYTLKLNEAGLNDIDKVGGKNASLGQMLQNLGLLGINIPFGFIITAQAYYDFITHNHLTTHITNLISKTDVNDLVQLKQCGRTIRGLIRDGHFPQSMRTEVINAYADLCNYYGKNNVDVAVRSSATAEDLPDVSFAGQQDTYLNVSGTADLMDAIRNCFASLFTDRAISYRKSFGYDGFLIGLSVCVQKMVRSDLGASGVAFSLDTESGFKDVVVINGSFGLGEMVVQGAVKPDEFTVFKPLLDKGDLRPLIEKKLGDKNQKMVYGAVGEARVKVIETSEADRERFCLTDDETLKLATWVTSIERYYATLKGKWCPMDVEWALDGESGELFIVQARPETIHSRKADNSITVYHMEDASRAEHLILQGIAVGDKIADGKVRLLHHIDSTDIAHVDFNAGDVLVTDMTDPDWEPLMKKAAAIITNKGGRTCHAAIVARELGVPAIVGCGNATELLNDGMLITASCAEGDNGMVYAGKINYTMHEHDLSLLPETATPVMMNVASPDVAFKLAGYPHRGVGLAREEFVINNYIKIHPQALLGYKELNDEALTLQITEAIKGYGDGETYFIEKLSYGVAKIAAAFYPQKVIVRFSDFKTNEYYNMPGGSYFEPAEENPMIGWRGASRYYSGAYKASFGMECKAIKKVREVMGLKNVVVMIPFCRTISELMLVYDTMREYGLVRGQEGLEVFLMAEVPSNVILAEQFAKHIDGFSIGSNDLTQLVLGLDRDSALVAGLYNERNDAVKSMISQLIRTAKKAGVKVGICGQGPSDYPDFAQFLVEEGIDSLSVTPDSFLKTVEAIDKIERQKVLAKAV
ncbi:phosphoenolpyruvate synthase [Mucilaginibacter yixingensis]|uniref:Phosphoenolpyruvate synthase n=2 Tax=Mucilaginibacter yixingensis TaxID=1295612 RepID=A0A2T5J6I0_9SPHI|nr:phosphoenolpyruvate synthase [Mucilaginibacter yixingensis]